MPNRRLLLPYAAPYFAYVAIASLLGPYLSAEWSYVLRIVAVAVLLFWGWRWYLGLAGPNPRRGSVAVGVSVGLLGAGLWIGLLLPFAGAGPRWSETAFLLRLTAATLMVPIFEELLMRGYVFRLALQWDRARKSGAEDPLGVAFHEMSVQDVEPGAWTWPAVAISTAAFTAGHQVREWPAAVVFGLLMSFLWIYRKDLLSCVVAHGTANLALGVFVRQTGHWGLW